MVTRLVENEVGSKEILWAEWMALEQGFYLEFVLVVC